jgi:hypothetical protein
MPGKPKAASPAVVAYAEEHQLDLANVRGSGAGGVITMQDAQAAAAPYVTPLVARMAAERGIDLATVKGTGAGGRIRRADIAPETAAATSAAEATIAEIRQGGAAALAYLSSSAVTARGLSWAANPLVDKVRAEARAPGARPAPTTAPPSLFASGAAPAFCASGIPVDTLMQVPWEARHPLASAATTQEAYAILSECSGPDGDDAAHSLYELHPGNVAYAERVQAWQASNVTEAEHEQMFQSLLASHNISEAGTQQ